MGSWNPKQLNPGSSASNQKSVKLQSHGAQICKGSSTCPKLLSYHAITSTTTHQLFHLTDTFTCSSSNFICCKCSKMYVGQAYKTLRDCFRHHRAAAKAKKRSWPLPLYMSRLQRWRILNWTLPPQQALYVGQNAYKQVRNVQFHFQKSNGG